jgi:hypothetical protein
MRHIGTKSILCGGVIMDVNCVIEPDLHQHGKDKIDTGTNHCNSKRFRN